MLLEFFIMSIVQFINCLSMTGAYKHTEKFWINMLLEVLMIPFAWVVCLEDTLWFGYVLQILNIDNSLHFPPPCWYNIDFIRKRKLTNVISEIILKREPIVLRIRISWCSSLDCGRQTQMSLIIFVNEYIKYFTLNAAINDPLTVNSLTSRLRVNIYLNIWDSIRWFYNC